MPTNEEILDENWIDLKSGQYMYKWNKGQWGNIPKDVLEKAMNSARAAGHDEALAEVRDEKFIQKIQAEAFEKGKAARDKELADQHPEWFDGSILKKEFEKGKTAGIEEEKERVKLLIPTKLQVEFIEDLEKENAQLKEAHASINFEKVHELLKENARLREALEQITNTYYGKYMKAIAKNALEGKQ